MIHMVLWKSPAPGAVRRPAVRRAAGPAAGSRPPSRRGRSRSACIANGRLRYTGKDPVRTAPRCVTVASESLFYGSLNSELVSSRLLGEATETGLIVVADPAAGNRSWISLPFGAKPPS